MVSVIGVDAASLARAIREQPALPVTTAEADALARAIEAARDDEELLTNALAAVRLLTRRLEDSA